ncbi:MAG TPA: nuclear transport factor 2 family protein [Blastocatellia bacterium]|nr:nuclear transport factor 2 family protein [Blastocatellia bacterium]
MIHDEMKGRGKVLEEHLRAENAHDVDAIMETFAQDARFIFNGTSYSDRNVIRIAHERFGFSEGGSFSDIRVEENRRYTCDNAIILEQTVSGKHTGEWGGIAATGRTVELPVCTVYTFDAEGKLAGENVYFDGALLLRQLGVLP